MTNAIANLHRAVRAQTALAAIIEETYHYRSIECLGAEDLADVISDLIADLLHLCVYVSLDTEQIITQVSDNFYAEKADK